MVDGAGYTVPIRQKSTSSAVAALSALLLFESRRRGRRPRAFVLRTRGRYLLANKRDPISYSAWIRIGHVEVGAVKMVKMAPCRVRVLVPCFMSFIPPSFPSVERTSPSSTFSTTRTFNFVFCFQISFSFWIVCWLWLWLWLIDFLTNLVYHCHSAPSLLSCSTHAFALSSLRSYWLSSSHSSPTNLPSRMAFEFECSYPSVDVAPTMLAPAALKRS